METWWILTRNSLYELEIAERFVRSQRVLLTLEGKAGIDFIGRSLGQMKQRAKELDWVLQRVDADDKGISGADRD